MPFNLDQIRVDAGHHPHLGWLNMLALLQKIGGSAGMAHAENQNLSAAQRHRLFVGMAVGLPEPRQPVFQRSYRIWAKGLNGAGDGEGQRHGQGEQHQPFESTRPRRP